MNTERFERTITIGGAEYPACYTMTSFMDNLRYDADHPGEDSVYKSQDKIFYMAASYINGGLRLKNRKDGGKRPMITVEQILLEMDPAEYAALVETVGELTKLGNERQFRTMDEVDDAKKETTE